VIVPDSCILLDYMLVQFTKIVDQLLVYPDNMKANLDRTHGLIFSQDALLALTKAGMKREDAYRIVQEEAMNVWQNGQSFRSLLEQREEVKKLVPSQELDRLFDPRRSLKNVDYIFQQVGLS